MKPVIGVMPLFDEHKDSLWMLPGYMKAIEVQNAAPIMLPMTDNKNTIEQLLGMVDGLLFTGGHDIHPKWYGDIPSEHCGHSIHLRDAMESYAYTLGKKMNIPMLGICRGLQLFNIMEGGTLYQDLQHDCPGSINHVQRPPYEVPLHSVSFPAESIFSKWLKKRTYQVNSYHHQAIKQLGGNLEILAEAEDGIIEAVKVKDANFIVAVQWHPEFCYVEDRLSQHIFHAFTEASSKYRTNKKYTM